jgi:hypothetical protein
MGFERSRVYTVQEKIYGRWYLFCGMPRLSTKWELDFINVVISK